MRLHRRPPPPETENVLPMINVVFLLLIFFMLAGAIEKADLFRLDPPETPSGREGDLGDGVLLMAEDGRLALDGQVLARESLAARLGAFKRDHPDSVLKLKADAAAEALAVVDLLEDLRRAGLDKVVLLAREGGA
jgi:biopolymer transport protein ExbD